MIKRLPILKNALFASILVGGIFYSSTTYAPDLLVEAVVEQLRQGGAFPLEDRELLRIDSIPSDGAVGKIRELFKSESDPSGVKGYQSFLRLLGEYQNNKELSVRGHNESHEALISDPSNDARRRERLIRQRENKKRLGEITNITRLIYRNNPFSRSTGDPSPFEVAAYKAFVKVILPRLSEIQPESDDVREIERTLGDDRFSTNDLTRRVKPSEGVFAADMRSFTTNVLNRSPDQREFLEHFTRLNKRDPFGVLPEIKSKYPNESAMLEAKMKRINRVGDILLGAVKRYGYDLPFDKLLDAAQVRGEVGHDPKVAKIDKYDYIYNMLEKLPPGEDAVPVLDTLVKNLRPPDNTRLGDVLDLQALSYDSNPPETREHNVLLDAKKLKVLDLAVQKLNQRSDLANQRAFTDAPGTYGEVFREMLEKTVPKQQNRLEHCRRTIEAMGNFYEKSAPRSN